MLIYISFLICLIAPSMVLSEPKLCTLDRCKHEIRSDKLVWSSYYDPSDTKPTGVQIFRYKEDSTDETEDYKCALHLKDCVTGCSCATSAGTAILVHTDDSWTVKCDKSFDTFTQAERRTIDYSSGKPAPVLSADGAVSGEPAPSSVDALYNDIRVAQQKPKPPTAPAQAPAIPTQSGNVFQQVEDEFANLELAMEDTITQSTARTTTRSTTTRAPITPVEVTHSTARPTTTKTTTTTTTTTAKVVSQEQSITEKTGNAGKKGKQAGETEEYDELGSLQTKYYVVVAFVIIFVFILIIIAVVLFMKMKQNRAGHAMISPGPDQEPLTPSGNGGAFTFDGKTPR